MNERINTPPLTIMLNALHLCQLLGYENTPTFKVICRSIHTMLWREWLDTPEFHTCTLVEWLGYNMPKELAKLVHDQGEHERKLHEYVQAAMKNPIMRDYVSKLYTVQPAGPRFPAE